MGYCAGIYDSDFIIPFMSLEYAYKLLCELDAHEGTGFAFPLSDTESLDSMTAVEVLEKAGFSVVRNVFGNVVEIWGDVIIDSDMEKLFSALAPVVEDGSFIEWRGEGYDDYYRYLFKNGKMHVQKATIGISWPEVE